MGNWRALGVIIGCIALLAHPSCACEDDSSVGGEGANASGGNAGSAASGAGGELGLGGQNTGGSGQGAESCAGETVTAEPIPLDMYIMLDRSGSMTEATGVGGVTKWEAVSSALSTFFAAPDSAGLGVAMQFFPRNKPGVPDTCTTHAQCGTSGPCFISVCQLAWNLGNLVPCATTADCGAQGPCIDLGECQNNPTYVCIAIGSNCGSGLGQCVDIVESFCADGMSCDAADYATPAVPMDTLPDNAAALDAEIAQQNPEGNTPTSPALQGTVDFCLTHKQQNPLHAVVAVLATDGIPTQCPPTDAAAISQIAADAYNGSPSVPTFVIGVVSPSDPGAQATLDQIAASGGTSDAFIVDPNGDVTQAFLDALNAIRGNALACEYLVPQPDPPDVIDYGLVNVEHTPPGASTPDTIPYVGSEANCDPVNGGWYYDIDPAQGDPTRILMCPATCAMLQEGGDLEIRVGCETVVPR